MATDLLCREIEGCLFSSFAFCRTGCEQILNILCLLRNEGVPSFDCVPLCFVFFGRSKGGRAAPFELVFEAEKIQHVDSLLACEWRGDVELPWRPVFVVIDAPALVMRSCW